MLPSISSESIVAATPEPALEDEFKSKNIIACPRVVRVIDYIALNSSVQFLYSKLTHLAEGRMMVPLWPQLVP